MKAAIYTVNASAQTVAAGGVLALGSIVRRFGNNRCCAPIINLSGNSIVLSECGYYKVDVNVTDAPAAAGAVTVQLYQDGVAVPGAVATNTAAAASDATSVEVPAIVRVGCANSTLTAVLVDGAGAVSNVAVTVVKL